MQPMHSFCHYSHLHVHNPCVCALFRAYLTVMLVSLLVTVFSETDHRPWVSGTLLARSSEMLHKKNISTATWLVSYQSHSHVHNLLYTHLLCMFFFSARTQLCRWYHLWRWLCSLGNGLQGVSVWHALSLQFEVLNTKCLLIFVHIGQPRLD